MGYVLKMFEKQSILRPRERDKRPLFRAARRIASSKASLSAIGKFFAVTGRTASLQSSA
jgi:hypothetical protein